MNSPFGSSHSSDNLRKRVLDIMLIELEGTFNPGTPGEMVMVEQLFGEVLEQENIVLSRTEKARLFEDVLNELSAYRRF